MYKLIIAEDELFVRIGLENAIKWADYQIEIVGSASNGDEALTLYNENHANIIITDIKMPVMDGIELIREIRKTDKEVRFIILTCMEDFHMAQQAMNYGVSYYFTKYDLNIEELKSALTEICKEFLAKNISPSRADVSEQNTQTEHTDIKEYLFNKNTAMDYVMQCYEAIDSVYCTAEILMRFKQPGMSERIEKHLENLVSQLLKKQMNGSLLAISENRIILLYRTAAENTSLIYSQISASVTHIMQMLSSYFELTSVVFLSDIYDNIYHTPDKLLLLQKSKCLPFYYAEKKIFYPIQDEWAERDILVKEQLGEIVSCYKTYFDTEYEEEFCYFKERIASSSYDNIDSLKDLFFHWGQQLMTIMRIPHEQANSLSAELKQEIEASQSFIQTAESFRDFISKVKLSIDEADTMSEEIIRAIEYIRSNLDQPITLSVLAEHIGFSAGYLSYIFKRELNTSFTDFLMKMRIKKAKLLLQHTDDKLYIIAEQTGFQDASYFNRVFKRATGITPHKFRVDMSNRGKQV